MFCLPLEGPFYNATYSEWLQFISILFSLFIVLNSLIISRVNPFHSIACLTKSESTSFADLQFFNDLTVDLSFSKSGGVVSSSVLLTSWSCLIKLDTSLNSIESTTSKHMVKCALKCSFSLCGSQSCFLQFVLNVVLRSFIFLYSSSTCLRFLFLFILSVSCLNFSFLRSWVHFFTAFVIVLYFASCFGKFRRWLKCQLNSLSFSRLSFQRLWLINKSNVFLAEELSILVVFIDISVGDWHFTL